MTKTTLIATILISAIGNANLTPSSLKGSYLGSSGSKPCFVDVIYEARNRDPKDGSAVVPEWWVWVSLKNHKGENILSDFQNFSDSPYDKEPFNTLALEEKTFQSMLDNAVNGVGSISTSNRNTHNNGHLRVYSLMFSFAGDQLVAVSGKNTRDHSLLKKTKQIVCKDLRKVESHLNDFNEYFPPIFILNYR